MNIDTSLIRLFYHLHAAQGVPGWVVLGVVVDDRMADAGRWHVGCNILNLILRTILLVLNLQVSILIYICKIYGLWRTCTCAEYEGNHVALALDLVSLIEPVGGINLVRT